MIIFLNAVHYSREVYTLGQYTDNALMITDGGENFFAGKIYPEGAKVIIAFKGTDSINDWLTNLRSDLIPFVKKGKAHRGFCERVSEHLYPRISEILNDKKLTNKKLIFTGHSLGGAVSILMAGYYTYREQKDYQCNINQIKVLVNKFFPPLTLIIF